MNEHEIYLAGGCFWGTEAYMKRLPGVLRTEVGYANSALANPSYEQVCSGKTGAVEAVRVVFDADVLTLPLLLAAYLRTIDPFSLDRQGNDVGRQYRTGIYWIDPIDETAVISTLVNLARSSGKKPCIECGELQNFYPAEQYHQDYLGQNPLGYCHVNLADADAFVAEHATDLAIAQEGYVRPRDEEIRSRLSPEAYEVTQCASTDRAHTHPYDQQFEEGIYVDVVSGEPLFSSRDKFDAGCGWPSFSRPIAQSVVTEALDRSIPSMPRVEVRSATANSHLGHVFSDGPAELGGQRYCINGSALRFIPADQLEAEGYGYLRTLFSECDAISSDR
jgi:peptide methionine sulfoxide reductase msrA/msrB